MTPVGQSDMWDAVERLAAEVGWPSQSECPTCGGSGRVAHESVRFFPEVRVGPQPKMLVWVNCPDCGGTGRRDA